jgi:hypothetical protein
VEVVKSKSGHDDNHRFKFEWPSDNTPKAAIYTAGFSSPQPSQISAISSTTLIDHSHHQMQQYQPSEVYIETAPSNSGLPHQPSFDMSEISKSAAAAAAAQFQYDMMHKLPQQQYAQQSNQYNAQYPNTQYQNNLTAYSHFPSQWVAHGNVNRNEAPLSSHINSHAAYRMKNKSAPDAPSKDFLDMTKSQDDCVMSAYTTETKSVHTPERDLKYKIRYPSLYSNYNVTSDQYGSAQDTVMSPASTNFGN